MRPAVVVPSCREEQLIGFVRAWDREFSRHGVRLYVVEDGPGRTFRLDRGGATPIEHLCWADAPPGMLECIDVRSPGCRQIGFWQAHRDGCELLITLDDDVRPAAGSDLVGDFADVLLAGIPRWVDPLLNYRSRGYPERNTGRARSDFHVGCFLGVPDVDAETQLRHESDFAREPPRYPARPAVVPPGFFLPVNGGVAGWRRDLTPFVHYTLWDRERGFRRFDDTWMGVILKQVLDLAGMRMSYGPPFVEHRRASDALENLERERAGKAWNERFWELLEEAVARPLPGPPLTPDAAHALLVRALLALGEPWARREGEALRRWRELFG